MDASGTPYQLRRLVARRRSGSIGEDGAGRGATVGDRPPDAGARADSGASGRTRRGAALLFSVLLTPRPPMPLWPQLSLVAGEAVAAALREQTGIDAALRHPNDVVVAGRKLAACFPRRAGAASCSASGSTCNQTVEELPTETAKPPTSVRIELGREVERAPLLAAILVEARARLRRVAAAAHEPLAVSGRRGSARGNCAPPRSPPRDSGPCPWPA